MPKPKKATVSQLVTVTQAINYVTSLLMYTTPFYNRFLKLINVHNHKAPFYD